MGLITAYREARREEETSRLRRVLVIRAMSASGMSQRQIAASLGITQPAVSQQLSSAPDLASVHPEVLLEAAKPSLRALAANHGYTRLSVFGAVARHEAGADSDIDLIVESPDGTSSFGFVTFKHLIEQVLGREIDLVDFGGLTPGLDDDVRRDAVEL